VAIARALATKPAVWLSDEPTSALDAETTASVLETLQCVRDEVGITIVLVTHELNAVRAICDEVAFLDHGRILLSRLPLVRVAVYASHTDGVNKPVDVGHGAD